MVNMYLSDPLFSTVILLASGVFGLALSRLVRISPIVGFFVIGAAIGPHGVGLIDNHSTTIHFLSELGVTFLLFDIGLHLSIKELRKGWQKIVLTGSLQFILVTTILTFTVKALGLSWFASSVVGAILSLSSTALVLKILSDEKEESSPVGKRATEILVFQDIIAILLLVILSSDLSKGVSVSNIIEPLIKTGAAALFFIVIGRWALKPLFKLLIALKSDEVFTAFALLLVFAAAWATQSLGLSLALGAFLGGLSLAESSYSHLVRSEISPFRSLLLSLFFLSVGINFELSLMVSNLWLLLGLLIVFSAAKTLGNWMAFKGVGIERSAATLLSLLLAQGSEFAFVLFAVAFSAGLITSEVFNMVVLLVGSSLALTPILAGLGCIISRSVCTVRSEDEAKTEDPREVVIVRIDEFGRQLASLLDSEHIPYRAHDDDLERLAYAKSRGLNVYYADLNRPRTLGRASVGKVLAVVCLMEDDRIVRFLIEGLHKIDRSVPILVATESPARLEMAAQLGVEQSFIKNEGSMLVLFQALVRSLGFEENKIDEALRRALQLLKPEELFPKLGAREPVDIPGVLA